MASVSYNGQCLMIDGRRIWMLGASIHYTRIPAQQWSDRIAAARDAGFNTIDTACPWSVHEPRKGRYNFHEQADVRKFLDLCHKAGMWVILRPGPYVGHGFDGGGIPGWIARTPGIALREGNELFLEFAGKYLRKLLGEISNQQVTSGGPILMVESEHAWLCANDEQNNAYLNQIARTIRESGIDVPIFNSNDLWQTTAGTLDTWRGSDNLLVHLRQLRSLNPDSPRIVSTLYISQRDRWGAEHAGDGPATAAVQHIAETLAAGAQPIVSPFHGGTNFGFSAGRMAGPDGGPLTTSAAANAPLGEAGARTASFSAVRRIITFAQHFGHVFSALDPEYQPIAIDLSETIMGGRDSTRGVTIIPQRGSQGRVVFAFSDGKAKSTTLLLDDGLRMPIAFGDQNVAWFVLGADLHGSGRLDYCNLCPWAIVDDMLVLHGPARAAVYLSIDGSPYHGTVPTGAKPLVVQHASVTLVICNQQQIDVTHHDDKAVYVGVDGFDAEGLPIPAAGYTKPHVIRGDGSISSPDAVAEAMRFRRRYAKINNWSVSFLDAYIDGSSPRYATLAGPETLTACGASEGYGWYSMKCNAAATKKHRCMAPGMADRMHIFIDADPQILVGSDIGALPQPFELRLSKGANQIVALIDNFGRFADGNDLGRAKGLFDHLYSVKTVRAAGKGRRIEAQPVDPFELRGLVIGQTREQLSDHRQIEWSFSHARKSPIVMHLTGAVHGTVVLNDQPTAYYAGSTGAGEAFIKFDPPELDHFKRGRNVIRFAPDQNQDAALDDIINNTSFYECDTCLTEKADWSFAKWEPPAASSYTAIDELSAKPRRGRPCWWRTTFDFAGDAPAVWFDTAGLSKGQVYVNGHNLGRYFTATGTGKAVGPQTWLYVPAPWLHTQKPNELVVFDEHGFNPTKTRLVLSETGEFE